jgi:hypothetical protein
MDLTNFNVDIADDNKSAVEPGRYVLNYAGEEEKPVEGKSNWRGHKMYFEIDGTGITINHTFTIGHDDSRYVDWGVKSLLLMAKAMGFESPPTKTETQMIGKSVSAELVKGDTGYLEINEQFGKTWQPTNQKPKPVENDNIKAGPSEADLDAMGTTVASEDDAPF